MSPTFYEQLFHTKVICAAFMCLQFGIIIFWQNEIGAKAAGIMLLKLTTGCRFSLWTSKGRFGVSRKS